MSGHTRGPWESAVDGFEWGLGVFSGETCVCRMDWPESRDGQHESNARLIAAAPDLFHAAAWMVGVLDTWANNESEEHIFAADATFDEAEEALREAVARVKEA